MALRGNLKDFSLPDVFQLVQLSKKTGVLRIKRPDAEGSIWFRDGEVFFAQSDWNREPLGQRLVAAGRVTPSALAKAMELRAREPEGGRRLGQILVDEGYITRPVLEAFVQEQIQDTIFDLMRWDEGEFDFEILPEVVEEDIGLSVSIENIVMEGSRRIDEWNRIKKKVPSMEMVFKMATAPGEGTFEISLKPTEWNLLLLTDGTRSVAELARDLGKTDFEVARIIYGLFSAGLLEMASDDEVERLRAERAEREARRAAQRQAQAVLETPRAVEALEPSVVPERVAPEAEAQPSSALEPDWTARLEPAAEASVVETQPKELVEEPEFLSAAQAAPTADDMAVFEQVMGAVLKRPSGQETSPAVSVVPEPVVEEPPVHGPAGAEPALGEEAPAVGPISPAELSEIPVAPVLETPPVVPTGGEAIAQPSFVPTGDLEKDLLALGLGELPVEETSEAVPGAEPSEPPSVVREPLGVADAGGPPVVEQVSTDAALSELLQSLAGAAETLAAAEGQEPPRVISTDAYLAEFEDDVSLTSALTDEITALTGGSPGRSRPVATVSKLPEPGEQPALHRDRLVDRDLVLKVIDGIEKL